MNMTGWWLGHPSEKYEFVDWDDDIPNTWENKIDVNQTTNQMMNDHHSGPVYFHTSTTMELFSSSSGYPYV